MADKEAKTHRVRLGGAWIYERPYPNGETFVVQFPAGSTVEMTDESYQSLTRMNEHTGRPTMKLERLAEGEAVEFSIPDAVKKVEADMAERGVSATTDISAIAVSGRHKALLAAAAATGDSKFSKAPTGATDEVGGADTKKGGK